MNELALRVTRCKIVPNRDEDSKLKAGASLVLNDALAIQAKVVQGNRRLLVAMPALRRKDGEFHDVAFPIVRDLREHIEAVVLERRGRYGCAVVRLAWR